ncbi:MAG: hypothetical protein CEO22_662 [Candidatus Berkelbacteria bacterium Gr01-1014_85]|uniref:Type IV pilus assembly protein PilN n=1 Tax=Candidatus Berkelbacteria bacterium Gr01-1014_85 TaxID=2017150 RepID=A0A554J986_9BACT|nr:MAG: hypothetical protein CEO22_662 [Candidatus Berkelbacteria bacterium Gr01-1014_85]
MTKNSINLLPNRTAADQRLELDWFRLSSWLLIGLCLAQLGYYWLNRQSLVQSLANQARTSLEIEQSQQEIQSSIKAPVLLDQIELKASDKLGLAGTADNLTTVSNLVTSLKSRSEFSQVAITSTKTENSQTNFNLEITIVKPVSATASPSASPSASPKQEVKS